MSEVRTAAAAIERSREFLDHAVVVRPGSRVDYLRMMLRGAVAACERGDYAISALAAARLDGVEVLSLGTNTLFSQRDPRGHAEANAVSGLVLGLRSRMATAGGFLKAVNDGAVSLPDDGVNVSGLSTRPLGTVDDPARTILYTSLEPCPMCTVVTLNSGFNHVVVAHSDPLGGALSPDGVHDMPAIWSRLARSQGLIVSSMADGGESTAGREIRTILALLDNLFLSTRERLDSRLGHGGILSTRQFGQKPHVRR